jgi:hypothetical protein
VTRRAVYVSPAFTILDGPAGASCVRVTPADTWSAGLGAFLNRVARLFDGAEGVVVLGGGAVVDLKLPSGPGREVMEGFDDARAAGWMSGKPQPWTVFYGDNRPTLIVGLASWPDFARCDIVSPHPVDTVFRLKLWHELTGYAWRGSPGIAGMHILRETLPRYPMKGARVRPSMTMVEGPDDGADAYEADWTADDWSRPLEHRYAHGYDATRMYLAAAQGCEALAPWRLHRTGRRTFDPKLAGWWKVELGPWNDELLPAPSGPGGPVRWVTTPTLALLDELQHAGGPFQAFEILDSWTAPGRRLLRPWADRIETAYRSARQVGTEVDDLWGVDQDGRAVQKAAKAVYRETIGLLKPSTGPGGPVYRSDWHYALIAYARSVLWRKAWAVGTREGLWPIEWDVDHLWYGSDSPDPATARPAGLPLVNARGEIDGLGTFKPKGLRERGKASV